MSRVTCHMSRVTCHLSRVTCHVSHVTYQKKKFTFNFFFTLKKLDKLVELVRWRVCYQRGLPRLVLVSVLLSASVKRCFVSCTPDFSRISHHRAQWWWDITEISKQDSDKFRRSYKHNKNINCVLCSTNWPFFGVQIVLLVLLAQWWDILKLDQETWLCRNQLDELFIAIFLKVLLQRSILRTKNIFSIIPVLLTKNLY